MVTNPGKRTRVTREIVYTAKHLKRYYPEAFKHALEKHAEFAMQESFRTDEAMDSLKGIFESAGVKMRDWEIGAYSHSYIRAYFGDHDDEKKELSGARAIAWLENNLFGPLRASYGLPSPAIDGFDNIYSVEDGKPKRRWTKPGEIKECPFTGVCYDMDFIDKLTKAIKHGDTLKEAFEGLAYAAQKTLESEYEYDCSEEAFIESSDANEWEFKRNGEMA